MQAISDCGALQAMSKDRRQALQDLNRRLPAINRILAELTPDHSLIAATTLAQHQPSSR